MTPPAPKSKAKRKAEPTEYVVLARVKMTLTAQGEQGFPERKSDVAWIEVDRVTAHGQEKTIVEKWATGKGKGGVFKLCPARSWKGGVRIFEQTRMTSEALSEASS